MKRLIIYLEKKITSVRLETENEKESLWLYDVSFLAGKFSNRFFGPSRPNMT